MHTLDMLFYLGILVVYLFRKGSPSDMCPTSMTCKHNTCYRDPSTCSGYLECNQLNPLTMYPEARPCPNGTFTDPNSTSTSCDSMCQSTNISVCSGFQPCLVNLCEPNTVYQCHNFRCIPGSCRADPYDCEAYITCELTDNYNSRWFKVPCAAGRYTHPDTTSCEHVCQSTSQSVCERTECNQNFCNVSVNLAMDSVTSDPNNCRGYKTLKYTNGDCDAVWSSVDCDPGSYTKPNSTQQRDMCASTKPSICASNPTCTKNRGLCDPKNAAVCVVGACLPDATNCAGFIQCDISSGLATQWVKKPCPPGLHTRLTARGCSQVCQENISAVCDIFPQCPIDTCQPLEDPPFCVINSCMPDVTNCRGYLVCNVSADATLDCHADTSHPRWFAALCPPGRYTDPGATNCNTVCSSQNISVCESSSDCPKPDLCFPSASFSDNGVVGACYPDPDNCAGYLNRTEDKYHATQLTKYDCAQGLYTSPEAKNCLTVCQSTDPHVCDDVEPCNRDPCTMADNDHPDVPYLCIENTCTYNVDDCSGYLHCENGNTWKAMNCPTGYTAPNVTRCDDVCTYTDPSVCSDWRCVYDICSPSTLKCPSYKRCIPDPFLCGGYAFCDENQIWNQISCSPGFYTARNVTSCDDVCKATSPDVCIHNDTCDYDPCTPATPCYDQYAIANPRNCNGYLECKRSMWEEQFCEPGYYTVPGATGVLGDNMCTSTNSSMCDNRTICEAEVCSVPVVCSGNECRPDPTHCSGYLRCSPLTGVWVRHNCTDGAYTRLNASACAEMCDSEDVAVCEMFSACLENRCHPPRPCLPHTCLADAERCSGYIECQYGEWVNRSCPDGNNTNPNVTKCGDVCKESSAEVCKLDCTGHITIYAPDSYDYIIVIVIVIPMSAVIVAIAWMVWRCRRRRAGDGPQDNTSISSVSSQIALIDMAK